MNNKTVYRSDPIREPSSENQSKFIGRWDPIRLSIVFIHSRLLSLSELPPGRPARPSENMKFKSELIRLHYIEVE